MLFWNRWNQESAGRVYFNISRGKPAHTPDMPHVQLLSCKLEWTNQKHFYCFLLKPIRDNLVPGFPRALDLSPLHAQKSSGSRLESQQKTLRPEKSYESGVHPNDFVIVYCWLVNSVLERGAAAFAIFPNHLANDMEKIQKCILSIIYPFTSYEDESLSLHQHCDVTGYVKEELWIPKIGL